ncbi:short-chain dehydrogenase [Diplodia corticola]|uniref:Short-chain dehydrogenase n=1 Tax=Diplodia corticola TaxID=236234 RepID=A0A1J9REI8_9PEZI|nr:short-chain dehydrogenase [Diplodia corticola]OJD30979.1 short-chain dehydrogenase [Diplodia corticola]
MLAIAISLLSALSAANAYTVINHDQFMRKNIDALVKPGQYCSRAAPRARTPTTSPPTGSPHSTTSPPLAPAPKSPPPMRFSTYYENILYADAPIPQDFSAIAGSARATTQSDLDDATTVALS